MPASSNATHHKPVSPRRCLAGPLAAVFGFLAVAASPPPAHADDETAGEQSRRQCISLSHIRRTEVIDDRTVLFHMSGSQIREVKLAFRCHSLSFYRSFGYKAYTNRLCSGVDSIVARGGSHCPISEIRTITEDEADALRNPEDD